MTRPLLLVAAGGLGREVAEAARARGEWNPIGFVDDDPGRWGAVIDGVRVLGGTEVIRRHPDAAVVLCPGKGRSRLAVAARLAAEGVTPDRYATVLGPGVTVPLSCSVGPGSVLLAGTVLTAGVTLGRHVVCMPGAVLTHDDVVEDGATLCAGVTLGGGVHVCAGAYLGMACSVREGVRIGNEAVVGMGAVVLNDVPAGQTWVGVPAAPSRSSESRTELAYSADS